MSWPSAGKIKLTNPSVTFSTGMMHLYLGTREVVLGTLPGHTGGDVLVYVPDANVMFIRDMGWSKTLPNLVDATVNDWVISIRASRFRISPSQTLRESHQRTCDFDRIVCAPRGDFITYHLNPRAARNT